MSEKYLSDYVPEESKSEVGSDHSTFDDILEDSSQPEIQQEEL